ncbi:hypothetical protein B5F07_14035 [Lachnoclostridium sp. An169]|uniref:glycosyltransferase family 2 protein n=1 Tax=Lachnoclostridium sp. An169 TaxID=1965569 RepID=UPI000B3A42C0|nr:glycosyltransferase family 2 protein [Lachnoclostridium sp. An169]OUP82429.1 hypothetical protein B5F07_14035 [Lachnoclostridium sp. An169]HJA67048.1 glycosyltransferase [Candidatus Mediterraneibacter cottocaccae]
MKDRISVIVPVYNEKKYLGDCVESILSQTWENIEVFLIDDGSDGETAALCDAAAAKDERIRVIHKKNEGSAVARETGIRLATGKWAAFIDSDDCLDGENALAVLAERAEQSGADITVGNYRRESGEGLSARKEQHFFHMQDQRCVRFRFCGFIRDGHLAYEWGKLYRLDFIRENGIHHTPYPFTQDKAFNMKCCLAGAKYAFTDESVYRYRMNENGVTFSYKKQFPAVWTAIAEEFDETQAGLPEEKRMGDLTATHVLLGLYYYGKQEILAGKMIPREIREHLAAYMEVPVVSGAARRYRREKYGKQFGSFMWKILFDILAFLTEHRMSGTACLMFQAMLLLEVENQVSTRRYRKKRGNAGKQRGDERGRKNEKV